MAMKINDAGQYVSEDGRWIWDGEAWVPNPTPRATDVTPVAEVVEEVLPERTTPSCNEQDCQQPAKDYVRIAMTAPNGSMTVECLLCEFHITTMEMSNTGQYMFVRPRDRLDLNGR